MKLTIILSFLTLSFSAFGFYEAGSGHNNALLLKKEIKGVCPQKIRIVYSKGSEDGSIPTRLHFVEISKRTQITVFTDGELKKHKETDIEADENFLAGTFYKKIHPFTLKYEKIESRYQFTRNREEVAFEFIHEDESKNKSCIYFI